MTSSDVFPYVWLALVAFAAAASLIKAVHDLRRGEGRWSMMGELVRRDEDPFHYWFMVVGGLAGFAAFCFMFWFGLDMLRLKG